jgi:hypothetical protein
MSNCEKVVVIYLDWACRCLLSEANQMLTMPANPVRQADTQIIKPHTQFVKPHPVRLAIYTKNRKAPCHQIKSFVNVISQRSGLKFHRISVPLPLYPDVFFILEKAGDE